MNFWHFSSVIFDSLFPAVPSPDKLLSTNDGGSYVVGGRGAERLSSLSSWGSFLIIRFVIRE